jgi:CubicO group peptidase (beta-lactamase class C family)
MTVTSLPATASVIAAMLILVSGECAGQPSQGHEEDTAGTALVGLWQGFTTIDGQEIRTEIELSQTSEGRWAGKLDSRDFGALGVPLNVDMTDDTISLTFGSDPFFKGRPNNDLGVIEGNLYSAVTGSWYELVLEKDNEAFVRFSQPRFTERGVIQREYFYRSPAESADGWSISSLADEDIDEALITRLIEAVLHGEQGRPEAILVARNGKLVLEEYFYGFSRNRIHSIQSATKSVTSLIFGIAIDAGHIGGVGQSVHRFFPEYSGSQWIDRKYPITFDHLLNMSAAVDWTATNHESITAMYRSGDWIGYVLDRDQVGIPGEVASYNDGLSILLGAAIRNTTGQYVDEFAKETLFANLGISKFRWLSAPDGTRNTSGGLFLSAYDLAKIGQLILDNGMWNGKRVVSQSWIAKTMESQLPLSEDTVSATEKSRYSVGYGYQWWHQKYHVDATTVEAIAGRGYGGQFLGIFPSLNTVIVLNNGEFSDPSERIFDANEIVEKWILPAIR